MLLFLSAVTVLITPLSGFSDMYIGDEVVGVDEEGRVEEIRIERSFIVLSKEYLYHHDILTVQVVSDMYLDPAALSMRVYKGSDAVPLLGLESDIPFLEENNGRDLYQYRAVFLPSWNGADGEYEVRVYYGGRRVVTSEKLSFVLQRLPPRNVKHGLSVVDLEMNRNVRAGAYYDPNSNLSDYRAILEWARFMGADALWILSGETTTFSSRNSLGSHQPWEPGSRDTYKEVSRGEISKEISPWDSGPLENLDLLKEHAPAYGIDIGAYIMCFYAPGGKGVPDRYKAGIGYSSDKDFLYKSSYISIGCERRILDIIELVKRFQLDPGVRYIGFDFIRTGRADGYELAPLVVRDTNIATPPGWPNMSPEEKARWFARKIEVDKDAMIIEKWRWWRAHRVAKIIERVISEGKVTKPVWVYTLGWNHGREHGQDPVMFFDAGVSIDAVMLYESDRFQFPRMLAQWREYIEPEQGNIIVGNCVDYRLLDSDGLSPPQEFFRRNVEGFSRIMEGGVATGIFFHDISRAFWGRKGSYSFLDYAISHGSSVYRLLQSKGVEDLVIEVEYEEYGGAQLSGYLVLKNNSTEAIRNVVIEDYSSSGGGSLSIEGYEPPVLVEVIPEFGCLKLEFHGEGLKSGFLRFIIDIEGNKRYFITEPIDSNP
jgi:hypothetical protein